MIEEVPRADIEMTVHSALAEDIGAGDFTAELIEPTAPAAARVIVRESATLCGCAWFDETFRQIDSQRDDRLAYARRGRHDTDSSSASSPAGPVGLLTGERTALNFLQTLSGTATATRACSATPARKHERAARYPQDIARLTARAEVRRALRRRRRIIDWAYTMRS